MTAKPDMTWGASTPCLDHLMRPLPSTTNAVADARVRNTGNIGIVTRVVATWDRAGRPQLKAEKEVRPLRGHQVCSLPYAHRPGD